MAKILYFASLAETLKVKSEQLEIPKDCQTVADLVALLRTRGEPFATAFDGNSDVLVAINQEMVALTTSIEASDEIAFFPPVTGG